MSQDGFGDPPWRPSEDDRTASPDGTPDKYLVRNTLNANSGYIVFHNEREKRQRFVNIELASDRVTCQVWSVR